MQSASHESAKFQCQHSTGVTWHRRGM